MDIKNLVRDIHITFIHPGLLQVGVGIGKNWFLSLALAIAGLLADRPSVTGERKVNVYAAVENSGSQAGTNRLLRSISACALRPVRSIGRHERNRKERHQAGTDWVR